MKKKLIAHGTLLILGELHQKVPCIESSMLVTGVIPSTMALTADMVPIMRHVPFRSDRLPKILHVDPAVVLLFWHCHDKAVMYYFAP